jgi:cytochrome c5
MKKITVSVSALFLALGVLSGCGEKKEEAPKAEAPAAEQKPAEQAAAPAMNAVTEAASTAADAVGDAAKATADVAGNAVDATKEAAGNAVDATKSAADSAGQAVGDAAKATADAAGSAVDATKQAVAAAGPVDGEKVYKGLCFSCHDMGIAGSPKLGDKADWGPRLAKGADALYKSAIEGRNNITPGKVMPAKGGNPALSDAEVKAAVDYMMSKEK